MLGSYYLPVFRPSIKPRLIPKPHLHGFSNVRIAPRLLPVPPTPPKIPGLSGSGGRATRPVSMKIMLSSTSSGRQPTTTRKTNRRAAPRSQAARRPSAYRTTLQIRKPAIGITGYQKARVQRPHLLVTSTQRHPLRTVIKH
jgi:hypothetical protein